MKPSDGNQIKLTSLNDKISPEAQAEPKVTKITKTIVTTQPVTETFVTKRVITTTTTRPGQTNIIQNTRYNNTPSSNVNKINTSNYSRPGTKITTSNNRSNNNINNRSINTNNQAYRNYQRPTNQINQPSRAKNSHSYSANKIQPKKIEVSSTHYKPRYTSNNPGEKRKTINRGKPIENVQITHIIYSVRPLDFHIIEQLNMDNLNTQPIKISEKERNNLQKSGKIDVKCSCDNIQIKSKPVDLTGTLTHYQHAQGIGMTDDKKENINPQFYFSEIKTLEPIASKKGDSHIEVLEFRSNDKNYKNYNTAKTVNKTTTKPVTNYSANRSSSNYNQKRMYNNTNTQLKYNSNNTGVNNRGTSGNKIITTNSNYRGSGKTGNSVQIIKETTTQVKMGNRSQFQNQNKPIVTTSTEKKVYNQNNFFKK